MIFFSVHGHLFWIFSLKNNVNVTVFTLSSRQQYKNKNVFVVLLSSKSILWVSYSLQSANEMRGHAECYSIRTFICHWMSHNHLIYVNNDTVKCIDYKGQVLQVLQVFEHYIKETPLDHRSLHSYLLCATYCWARVVFCSYSYIYTFSAFLFLNSSTKQREWALLRDKKMAKL